MDGFFQWHLHLKPKDKMVLNLLFSSQPAHFDIKEKSWNAALLWIALETQTQRFQWTKSAGWTSFWLFPVREILQNIFLCQQVNWCLFLCWSFKHKMLHSHHPHTLFCFLANLLLCCQTDLNSEVRLLLLTIGCIYYSKRSKN